MRGSVALRVTLLATTDTQVGPLSGLYEALTAFPLLEGVEEDIPARPFEVEIATVGGVAVRAPTGLTLDAHRALADVESTDVAVVPLMSVEGPDWLPGRHPEAVAWLRDRHREGAVLASACTGVLLLAETGLLDGREATIHWAYAGTLRRCHPAVRVRARETLVTAGDRGELVMTGGVMSWHDLALHLIARYVGPTAARAMARMLMLEWHGEGQAPYASFAPRLDHGDGVVSWLQRWLGDHVTTDDPVAAMVELSGLSRRTLERRFRKATGRSPLRYVQALRVDQAKRLLERTRMSAEKVAHAVGYENAAFFRRLFRRSTRLTPGAYRRKFRGPR